MWNYYSICLFIILSQKNMQDEIKNVQCLSKFQNEFLLVRIYLMYLCDVFYL